MTRLGVAPAALSPAEGVRPFAGALRLADRVLSFGSASHLRACLLLVLIGLASFLPGLASLQPMDRDEPRFAQASKQMLETGDLVDIRFQAEARHKKPVGIYWAQAAAVAAGEALGVPRARTQIGLYRIPSLLGALAAILLTYWAGLALLDRRRALLAAALFAACIMLSAEARLAKTDALLTACSVAAFGALARAWLGRARLERRRGPASLGTALVFWLGIAFGILVKGPMVPLFAGLAALVLSLREGSARWLLDLRPRLGLLVTLAVVAPWFLAIAWKSGGAFFGEAVGRDMLGKVGTGAEKHWGPPGAYALAFFATFWPGAAFAALSLPFAWAWRGEEAVALLLAWIVPMWLIFEAVPTKLPHYVLPLMPAVAILTVLALSRGGLDPRRPGARWVAGLVVLIPVGLTLALSLAAWRLDGVLPLAALPLLLVACALAGLAWAAFARGAGEGAREGALVLAVAASVVLSGAVFGLTQPVLQSLKVSPRLAAIRDALPCEAPRVASLGLREPSLVFTVGTDLAMLNSGAEAIAFLREGGCRLVLVEDRFAAEFAAVEGGQPFRPAGRVTGFNINGGKPVGVSAYAALPGATP
ncbi:MULTISPECIES: ArnT family glycosyltransferase [Methylorubrum]|uniref:ArnT family glycosyltransferase n=1 Tax=Methylorubrum TaxID=2282523 RepID=UPI00209C9EC9|nr:MULTISPECIES: glycosyltransferase family 39 protein [Methylorubrum]MCP1550007.1 4-amino-4-deoxy-L-arabinose transferase-like glycosyltransferase [Methylorubrum zatmanii]MCP1553379.1 4-amino-4-deoxy-L-arabinose transferase-like glycosyltransferase [Methylorubrum extorquens]MCP1580309.1 4-amino-4-deoxy-L-arabinose transferase-like glycosyltransferase [Methylorubrum extorquens]